MKRLLLATAMALLVFVGAGPAQAAQTPPPQAKGALKTAAGEAIGSVLLTQLPDGRVYISADVKGLPPGEHGFTMREKGACTPNFDAAGAVFKSDGLPKLTVKPDKTGVLEAFTTNVSVAPTDKTVLDADGTAVIITAFGDESQKAACAVLEAVPVPSPVSSASTNYATAEIKTAAGESVGSVNFTQNADGSVRVQAQVRGLPAGEHAMHVHQFGQCAPTFGAAGEHTNPYNKSHGMKSNDPMHAGDLPNIVIGADGSGSVDATSTLFTLTPGDTTILDSDGSAVIIHANPDDMISQPGGMADGRIACGVVQAASLPAGGAAPSQPNQPTTPATLPSTGAGDGNAFGLLAAFVLLSVGLFFRRVKR